mgnify:FL=1
MTLVEVFAREERPTLRAAIAAALLRPGAPTQAALAAAADVTPQNLNAWLHGRRTIPVRAIEAMLVQLDLVIVPRASTPHTATHAAK